MEQTFGHVQTTKKIKFHWYGRYRTNLGDLRQRAKKVLSDSPGLVDFAIGLVNFVFNLPNGQVIFYEEFE